MVISAVKDCNAEGRAWAWAQAKNNKKHLLETFTYKIWSSVYMQFTLAHSTIPVSSLSLFE